MGALVACGPVNGAVQPDRTADDSARPAAVDCGDQVRQLALGYHHSCGLLASGRVVCWGDNSMGQLGTGRGTPTHSFAPILVPSVDGIVELHANGFATCARKSSAEVWCWGGNLHGEVDPHSRESGRSAPFAEGGYDWTGEPPSFSPGNIVGEPRELKSLRGARSLSMGVQHGCATFDDGRVICWGDASDGQLGASAVPDAFQIGPVQAIPAVVEVACDGDYSCGRTASGDVWCWGGNNERGELGTTAPRPAPRRVADVTGARAVMLAAGQACARLARGEMVCWGGSSGCEDTPADPPPTLIKPLNGKIRIVRASGGAFSCTLDGGGQLTCDACPAPFEHHALSMPNVATVGAGSDHGCASRFDGSVWCWGANERGQLGRHTSTNHDAEPTPVKWPRDGVAQACATRGE
jgi:alpha-tubulin suppressor-like RCC1 family protein